MPSPIYIICSEDGVVDKLTNSVSIFGVIERLRFIDASQLEGSSDLPHGRPWVNIRMTATWKREESEAGSSFEHQTLLWMPGQEQAKEILAGSFVFKHDLHRFIADMGFPPTGIEGILRIENKVRELGHDEWLSQSYDIPVEKMSLASKSSER